MAIGVTHTDESRHPLPAQYEARVRSLGAVDGGATVRWDGRDARGRRAAGGVYLGYDGPCPPWNDEIPHHYHFVLYATDLERCPVEGAFSAEDVETALIGHVLASAKVTGLYLPDGRQHIAFYTLQDHVAGNCLSDLMYQGALMGKAR